VPAPLYALGAIASVQVGATVARHLFAFLGATGTVFLRVAFGACILLAIARPRWPRFDVRQWRAVVLFGLIIAAMNLVILLGIVRVFRKMRTGSYDDRQLEEQLDKRGLMNRFFGPLARRVDAPWKIYPIGVLFGLGFDTASEVALLVLAGSAVVSGLPFYAILSLPILFAAGMCLFDTADGCFMNFAYDWAFARPVRKVYYNLTITGLSVFVAVFIGAVELLGLLAQDTSLNGSFWTFMQTFNINTAGLFIVGVFVLTWIVALAVWHFGRIEQKWETGRPLAPDTPE